MYRAFKSRVRQQIHVALPQHNVGGLGEHVTCHIFWFLIDDLCFSVLYYTSGRARRPILTINGAYHDVFSRKEVLLCIQIGYNVASEEAAVKRLI